VAVLPGSWPSLACGKHLNLAHGTPVSETRKSEEAIAFQQAKKRGGFEACLLLDGIRVRRSALTLRQMDPDRSARRCCSPPKTRSESR